MSGIKVLILGGSGMLGHKLWQTLSLRFDTYATVRRPARDYADLGVFDQNRLLDGVVLQDFVRVEEAIVSLRPDVIVNCIGIVKQDEAATDPIASITANSLFPHRLAQLAKRIDARFIHLSTDCVFSGRSGNYSEDIVPDPYDLYGRSKLLGEVTGPRCLTIRTSMIGRELSGTHGLLEWFLSQRSSVRGFKHAIFSGFTTIALSQTIEWIVSDYRELAGIWHVSSDPISKFDLLSLVKQTYELATEIMPDDTFTCDRSLNSLRFRDATGFRPTSWPVMIKQLRTDPTPYDEIRKKHDS